MPTPKSHDEFMSKALHQAVRAMEQNEVPVGAVLVKDGKVISRGFNLTRTRKDPTAHAEIVLLQRAARKLRNERLTGADLYVTLEPCAMCAGAIIQARLAKVIFGAFDPKAGACGSVLKVIPNKKLNHRPNLEKGIRREECAGILKDFFKKRR